MKFLDQAPRFLFFTGKGGVGKTSIACATAIELAAQGKRVLLVSTDPASNVGQVFGIRIGNQIAALSEVPHLSALEIDPQAAAQAYRDRIVGPVRGVLPESVVKGIEEQLSGACTTEIAAFDKFIALLVDATGAYHRDISRQMGANAHFTTPMMQLPDPKQTKMLIVTLAETTPVLEAANLQADLRRAGIEPRAWVINNSVAAAPTTTPAVTRWCRCCKTSRRGRTPAPARGQHSLTYIQFHCKGNMT